MQSFSTDETLSNVSPHLLDILTGLQRQREELGSVADELIDLFREHGVALPHETEGEAPVKPCSG